MSGGTEASPKRVVVATHGHCFDGAASAAIFTRLLRQLYTDPLAFTYRACGYAATSRLLDASTLHGDLNAVLDYRYTAHPNLHWYFDHHPTAFATDEDRAHFLENGGGQRFHDASYGSCARLVADVARDRFGVSMPDLDPLVHWAEVIDTASFDSAEQAIARDHPVLQLMTVLEHAGNTATLGRLVPRLAERHVEQVASEGDIRRASKRFARYHREFVKKVRTACQLVGSVVYVDLSGEVHEVVGKFVTYALFPSSSYSVILTRGHQQMKVSIGFNPWSPHPRQHHIGAICARHGGGGHAVVGAVALPVADVDQARNVALNIARELDS